MRVNEDSKTVILSGFALDESSTGTDDTIPDDEIPF